MLNTLFLVLTLNKLLDEVFATVEPLRNLGWSRFGSSFDKYFSYCAKFNPLDGCFLSPDCMPAFVVAHIDESEVNAVLVESTEPVEKVRP